MTEQQTAAEDNFDHVAYHISQLDNGIVIEDREYGFAECEKYSDKGKPTDKAVIRFLGRKIWNDILAFSDKNLSSHIKMSITFEDEEMKK